MSRWGDAAAPAATPWPSAVPAPSGAGQAGLADHEALRWPDALQTPCYVFDPAVVGTRYRGLRAALGGPLLVSLKANPNPDLFLRSAHAFDDGIEVASPGELELAVGRGRHDLYLNNPALGEDFIRAGIASRATFVVDGPDAGRRLLALAPPRRPIDVLLRINVAALLGRSTHAAWRDHFGMAPGDAGLLARCLAQGGLRVIGLHAFAGSHRFRIDAGRPQGRAGKAAPDALALAGALARLADDLSPSLPEPLRCLNLGGGFGATARGVLGAGTDDESGDGAGKPSSGHDDLSAEAMRPYREGLAPIARRYRVLHEAGRALYADAGDYLTRVTALKHFDDRIVAVCDGGLSHNFLLAQTESALKSWRVPRLVGTGTPGAVAAPDPRPVVFIGNTCHRGDILGRLPPGSIPPRRGQLAVFDRCGAYHATYTVGSFLSHRPARTYIRQGSLPAPAAAPPGSAP